MQRTLQMVFRNADGRNTTISVADPVDPLDAEQVDAVMQLVVDRNIFDTSGGEITGKVRAQVVSRQVETIVEY